MCFCETENCNVDKECVCDENGLQCQVCGGEANDGMCMDQNDNGESKTCPDGTVCAYFVDGNFRNFDNKIQYFKNCPILFRNGGWNNVP